MQKLEKEREIARLRAQQERAKDKQAEKVGTLHILCCGTPQRVFLRKPCAIE